MSHNTFQLLSVVNYIMMMMMCVSINSITESRKSSYIKAKSSLLIKYYSSLTLLKNMAELKVDSMFSSKTDGVGKTDSCIYNSINVW